MGSERGFCRVHLDMVLVYVLLRCVGGTLRLLIEGWGKGERVLPCAQGRGTLCVGKGEKKDRGSILYLPARSGFLIVLARRRSDACLCDLHRCRSGLRRDSDETASLKLGASWSHSRGINATNDTFPQQQGRKVAYSRVWETLSLIAPRGLFTCLHPA